LNIGFVLIEAGFGLWSNSVALLADAGHNLSDVLALLAAWGASVMAKAKPTARYSYGLRSSSMLAALFNAASVLLVTGGIAWEAVRRLFDPQPSEGSVVIAVALAGVVVNGATALMFARGAKSDINIRAVFAHMASDALVSLGVAAAGGLMLVTAWLWLDPLASLLISAVIVWGTWGLLKESVAMVMAAAPTGVDPAEVRRYLEAQAGVAGIHDLHIWPISTTETALTVHLRMPDGHPGDAFLGATCEVLHRRFKIGHSTIQVETGIDTVCALEPEHVV
jgi:cobalt-zinc-cadmium efflux system protein